MSSSGHSSCLTHELDLSGVQSGGGGGQGQGSYAAGRSVGEAESPAGPRQRRVEASLHSKHPSRSEHLHMCVHASGLKLLGGTRGQSCRLRFPATASPVEGTYTRHHMLFMQLDSAGRET